jgi:hypothetical protein
MNHAPTEIIRAGLVPALSFAVEADGISVVKSLRPGKRGRRGQQSVEDLFF